MLLNIEFELSPEVHGFGECSDLAVYSTIVIDRQLKVCSGRESESKQLVSV